MLHEELWQANQDLAQACLEHPFVQRLAGGSLDPEAFRRYVAQDAFFLRAFAKAYAIGLARADDSETIELFHNLIGGVAEELKLHAGYSAELGIELQRVKPNPACRAYTDFLLHIAWHTSLPEIVAAMTPCMRLYAFLGAELAEKPWGAAHPYRRWVETYSGEDFRQLTRCVEGLLDRVAAATPPVRDAYRYVMHCELRFFSDALEGRT